jgi:hypothetical protein
MTLNPLERDLLSKALQPSAKHKDSNGLAVVKKKQKTKEPNPLSCKKPKKIKTQIPAEEVSDEKKKRKHRSRKKALASDE